MDTIQRVDKTRKLSQGVDYYDWESNLKIHLQFLRVMGLWPSGDKSFTPGLYMLYSYTIVLLVACHVFFLTINIYFVRHDLEAVVANMYILLATIVTKIKAWFLLINIKVLKARLVDLQNFYSFQPKNPNQTLLIENSLKTWRFIFTSFVLTCFGCNLFWMVPLLLTSGEKMLPFLAWYPFNTKVSPVFEITYVYQMFCTSYLTLVSLNVDPLVCIFNVYIACQFEMLSDNLKKFASGDLDEARENFLSCITHHRQILSFLKGCNQFYKWIVFWHLIISGISIGIGMFQLCSVAPLSTEFYSLVSFESAVIVQISMYCYFGNNVEVTSNLVSYALFESGWPDLSENMKKELLIFTANVQQPVKVSCFNIFMLSLDTLLKILKTAWSYFALLSNLKS
ncbi:hypothetical protein Zmor_007836 [Zophobas morio]|uniref:Odorant receptor n=1 Tax=Zophobas morio TaxID=2755281 RepID=A0AA38IZ63_9CUCU|nr:hypothetical protein Zmor_007836 [Zophobas morio]